MMIIDAQHHYRVKASEPVDLATRLAWMDDCGISLAILTNNMQHYRDQGMSTWSKWNDELAEVEREHPDRFVACPSIPTFDGDAAIEEFDRVTGSYKTRAVLIQPFKWRIDYDYLLPLYEKINSRRIPIFFHPIHTDLSAEEVYGTSALGAAIGFPFNTSVAISRFVSCGVLDYCKHLRFVIPHLGGALPFLMGRLESIYDPIKYKASRPPSGYLDNFLFDVVCYTKPTLEFAASVLGSDRLVFGTDFGCPDKNLVQPKMFRSFVEELPIGPKEKHKIFSENLANLLKISVPEKGQALKASV
jgi:aminocarboxymuconate-semialdehyde decarboxylase